MTKDEAKRLKICEGCTMGRTGECKRFLYGADKSPYCEWGRERAEALLDYRHKMKGQKVKKTSVTKKKEQKKTSEAVELWPKIDDDDLWD